MKTTIFRSNWFWLVMLIAGAHVAPARLSAQRADQTRNHIVKPGDTLWKLSARYLGDGNRWKEFLSANPALGNRSALKVGATLRIPGSKVAAKPAAPGNTDTASRNRVAERAQRPYITDTIKRTIFFGTKPAGGFTTPVRPVNTDPAVPASIFEGVSAPFVVDDSTLEDGGRCVSVGPAAAPEARGVLLQGSIEVQLPAGTAVDTASRWILVRRGPLLTGLGIVAIPTGVVRLTSKDDAVNAEVVAQFDKMSCDDVLLPADIQSKTDGGQLTPVNNGPRGVVVWVPGETILPTLQHALILSMGSDVGVRLGDRVTIYGGNGGVIVANADIVRVDRRTATALLVSQTIGSPSTGMRVRVTEKLP
jgi:LysM repeat protein